MILVPQGPSLFGTLDRRLGHKRRYRAEDIRALLEAESLAVETVYQFNKAGTLPWWIYSRIFATDRINKPVLKIFDKTVWLWRRIDGLLPWRGLSLILIARNAGSADTPEERGSAGAVPQGLSQP